MAKRRRKLATEDSQSAQSTGLGAIIGTNRNRLVLSATAGAIAFLAVVIVVSGPAAPSSERTRSGASPVSPTLPPSEAEPVSDEPLLGEAVLVAAGSIHVADPRDLVPGDLPDAGGPHATSALTAGVFDNPIAVEASAVHSLEHGVVWITYAPSMLSRDAVTRLEGVVEVFSRDVILAPRPRNVDAIVLVSWGQRLVTQDLDETLVADFIRTNRNRSPEPGIR